MAGPFLVGRNHAVIDAPASQVFEYLSDLSRYSEWNDEPDFAVTLPHESPTKAGSQFRRERTGPMQGPLILRGGMGESRVTLIRATTVTAHNPDSLMTLETQNIYNGLLHSVERMTFSLQETPEGTEVTLVSEVEAMVPSVFIGPVYAIRAVRGLFERLLGRRLAGMFPAMSVGPHLSRIKAKVEAERAV